VKIKPLLTPQGSVLEGINKTKSLMAHGRLTMDPTCEDLAWEKENYSWKLDKNDNALEEPVKEQEDACDMERYAVAIVHLKEWHVFRVRTA
jgi:phage terminase large subunit